MMGKKADLQARADELGVAYAKKDTIAVLTEKIAAATGGTVAGVDDDGRCVVCKRPGGSNHVHTRLGKETT